MSLFAVLFTIAFCSLLYLFINNKIEGAGFIITPIALLTCYFYGSAFNNQMDKLMYKHYAKYGQFTVGTIANGVHEWTDNNKYGQAFLAVKFTSPDSNLVYVNTQISPSNFNSYYKAEEIALMYCTNEPKRAKVFQSKEELEMFIAKIKDYK
jgi:hypothetical protein